MLPDIYSILLAKAACQNLTNQTGKVFIVTGGSSGEWRGLRTFEDFVYRRWDRVYDDTH